MQITFYINTSPTNKVNKSLTQIKSINIDIYEQVDVVNPVIRVDRTDIPSEANYMVCGEPLNRRYFITAMDFTNAKTTIIAGHCDVLSTYHGFLENTVLNYVRGEGDLTEVEDASFPISDYITEQHYSFSGWQNNLLNGDNQVQYILRTVCGDAQAYPTIVLTDGAEFRYQKWVYSIHLGSVAGAAYISFYAEDPQSQLPSVQNNGYITISGQLYRFEASPYINSDPELSTIVYLGTA